MLTATGQGPMLTAGSVQAFPGFPRLLLAFRAAGSDNGAWGIPEYPFHGEGMT